MKVLIDTDAFCTLAVAESLRDAVSLLGAGLAECGRLAALPYMLKNRRLRTRYGPEVCDSMALLAEEIPVISQPSDVWLDKLAPVQAIDPGEAQLFAVAAEHRLMVLSGDKRALVALKEVDDYPEALAGRIVSTEAILLALCDHVGPATLRQRLHPLLDLDKMIRICFSSLTTDPKECLQSYYRNLASEVEPLTLWRPSTEP